MADSKPSGYKLPVDPTRRQGTVAQGFVTPKQDRAPQLQSIPPRRVLPIIFIPGIMGSNLRMSAERQRKLGSKSNIAWRPDHLAVTIPQANDTAAERQLRLDPANTELDIYDPENNSTGRSDEKSDDRNDEVKVIFRYSAISSLGGPMLESDLPGTPDPKTKDQKARARGWGEVYFSSYQDILALCEEKLNAAFLNGNMHLYLRKFILGVSPKKWQAHTNPPLDELDEKTMRQTVKGCWFPVHAMGYNWQKGNRVSGILMAKRISSLIKKYNDQGFECEKVILVTHSMGGLVARAAIHPEMGNISEKVLGIIHGVMPAMGAGTAYKRVRCGFEGKGISSKILGHLGTLVTPVLANAQGGLELLPSQAYGNNWLQIKQDGKALRSYPQNGDPYEEIYKVHGKWFGLLREDWINPGDIPRRGFEATCQLLDQAKSFHSAIANTYHTQSYAHYGADKNRMAWQNVIWELPKNIIIHDIENLKITKDDAKGTMFMSSPALPGGKPNSPLELKVTLQDATEPGDQTVPLHSADAQLQSGKFKGIFRQTGYEHQASYSDDAALASTIYSLFKIISTMKWSKS